MRATLTCLCALCVLAPAAGAQELSRVAPAENLLTRYLDWADIHPPVQVGRLTVFPICLSRPAGRLEKVLTMDQALRKKLLVIEELASPRVEQAQFTNKSPTHMIFLMAGELITGGKQNRTLTTDALLGPNSSTVLPLYCVQKGRWRGGKGFEPTSAVVPYAVRERAARGAGQKEIWSEVTRANSRLGSKTASEDLAAAMAKPENVRRFAALRKQVVPSLPKGCVGIVVVVGGQIVAADLFNSPELFAAIRRKVLDSYLSQYAWPLPVRRLRIARPPRVTAEQVREYLRGCYRSRFVAGERRGVGRIYHLRGVRSGQTLGYDERSMVHAALMARAVIPVRPAPMPRPVPRPLPRPLPRR